MKNLTGEIFHVVADYVEEKEFAVGTGFSCFTMEQAETIANNWRLSRPDLTNIKIRSGTFSVDYD